MSSTYLIVGLGNPGKEYEYTRHNLGFLVLRRLAEKLNRRFKISSLTNGLMAEGQIQEKNVCLLMPMTFMNNSGVAVSQVTAKKNVSPKNLLVVCDDLNLNFGQIRLRSKGSDGGHNGLNSVIHHLGTEEFLRLRMGVGHPGHKLDVVDYVLAEFKPKEKEYLENFIGEATGCCLTWVSEGIKKGMEQYNRRKENGKE
ncbi:MAG TPA: aminoacyl-tRNA hydrolase [Candidatus Omnitrophica bacterium]|nr:MAG: aminoacyl-tRNA hydrolase [Omnitrophica WOR_2 bacterium GWA2_45_18]OGX18383.1 MAG: aminoacyl-tRNA hydrolase [Omnitrophica WOR_2 bacterium GWC2_45_7]HBR14878.1 aminoacyl-tRNA hydrolase [Candidatus Omnitrophota bacterium]